ncbi:HD domain-containing protein [Candidatus Chloroploca sp. M-50]|uniref:HD domain-containing protein n=1 Tax=Candidatus Chloroploca mongolica TaxID=2528176 RepID=A0ABS4DFE5_9CHLR|nr:HD domain-containing protein [Candidatus Chloroploca mongolica]MBP1468160.1 HD domain-containing protein [Candidatus Chloroploca mongolica]
MNHAALIADLLAHPRVVETRHHLHHSVSKHDHMLRVARYSYALAPLMGADQRTATRAAILHDLDSRLGTLTTHGAIAARVAAELGEGEEVSQAIVSHMYPLGPRPTTREGWVLAVADKIASVTDLTTFVSGLFTGQSIQMRRQLCASDPFYAARHSGRRRRQLITRLWRREGRQALSQ